MHGSGRTSACWWEGVNFAFPFKMSLYQSVRLPTLYFLTIPWERGRGCLFAGSTSLKMVEVKEAVLIYWLKGGSLS